MSKIRLHKRYWDIPSKVNNATAIICMKRNVPDSSQDFSSLPLLLGVNSPRNISYLAPNPFFIFSPPSFLSEGGYSMIHYFLVIAKFHQSFLHFWKVITLNYILKIYYLHFMFVQYCYIYIVEICNIYVVTYSSNHMVTCCRVFSPFSIQGRLWQNIRQGSN